MNIDDFPFDDFKETNIRSLVKKVVGYFGSFGPIDKHEPIVKILNAYTELGTLEETIFEVYAYSVISSKGFNVAWSQQVENKVVTVRIQFDKNGEVVMEDPMYRMSDVVNVHP